MAAACAFPLRPRDRACPIPHFSVQKRTRERPLCGRYVPSIGTSAEPAAADFYPTVKAALRHESADTEEDR